MAKIRTLPSRQVHLDFHTGPFVPGVGAKFNKAQFQQALKLGNVNSITVFAKCHHGLTYYPSQYSKQHPSMEPGFDLTGAMIEACHEIGVAAPVYITVGFSEDDAKAHQEWRIKNRKGEYVGGMPEDAAMDTPRPFFTWDTLCPSGAYAELVYKLTEEVCQRYKDLDGLFYDIIYMNGGFCWCDNCMKRMQEMGRDPYNDADVRANYEEVHHIFAQRCTEILHKYHPSATVFFNSGGAEIYYPERHCDQTHFEMEDLPTAWGGYDKFVPRASVMRQYDKEILGMTGKFHACWGEFGGYKNFDAMEYEALCMGMYGVYCSIGDQMPPSGELDLETYRLIGQAYNSFEKYEPWFFGADDTTKLGVYLSGDNAADEGLHKMLLERQMDFRVILPGADLFGFDALILPDCVKVSDEEAERLNAFQGAILFSGTSLVKDGKFQIDVGCEYAGQSAYELDYFRAEDALGDLWIKSPFICYNAGQTVRVTDGEVLAQIHDPWFRRTKEKFCSHCNTPYDATMSGKPAVVRKGNRIYFAHNFPTQYFKKGTQLYRDAFLLALNRVYTPVCSVKMPSAGRMRFTNQTGKNRYVLHLSYAQPIIRGEFAVLEDMPELYNVPVCAKVSCDVKEVKYALSGEEIAFTQNGDVVEFTVPKFRMYTAIEIAY